MAQIHVAADSIHCTMRLAQRVLLECDHAAANVPKRETIGISASMLKKHDTVQARWRIIAPAVLDIYLYIYIYIYIPVVVVVVDVVVTK